ncbi:MAG: hypothetical protein ACKVP4_05605 [Hyphomicrobium sp.]
MSSHFETYVDNLNRLRMVDLIDRYSLELQRKSLKPSLICNPITGRPYDMATYGHTSRPGERRQRHRDI